MELSPYDWLHAQIAEVRTNKFFVTQATDERAGTFTIPDQDRLPPSYRQFIAEFGAADLYRDNHSNYHVRVFSPPRPTPDYNGHDWYWFGRTESATAYFRQDLLKKGYESPVFEWRYVGGLRQTFPDFREWLEASCARARKKFTKTKWRELVKGPPPLTPEELEIVAARRRFVWECMGLNKDGDLVFRVTNMSTRVLPYLCVGIKRGSSADRVGSIKIPVGGILPGTQATLAIDAYKKYLASDTAVPYDLPDPGPEDRELYWEFRKLDQ